MGISLCLLKDKLGKPIFTARLVGPAGLIPPREEKKAKKETDPFFIDKYYWDFDPEKKIEDVVQKALKELKKTVPEFLKQPNH